MEFKLKLLIVFCISALALTAGQKDKTPVRETPKVEIPAGAVKSEDGSYHYTDPKTGKKWVYRQTPFGIARAEDKPVEKTPEVVPEMKVTEDGDSLRFERPGPFGTYKWQRKKTDLNDTEKAAWEREKARAAAKQD
jgi:hypothetical protein